MQFQKKYLLAFIVANFISSISYNYKSALLGAEKSKFVFYSSIIAGVLNILIIYIAAIKLKYNLAGAAISYFVFEIFLSVIYRSKYNKTKNY